MTHLFIIILIELDSTTKPVPLFSKLPLRFESNQTFSFKGF